MVIRPGSGCYVTIFSNPGFKTDKWTMTDSCPDFNTCVNNGNLMLNYNDIMSSFYVNRGL
jgi:hypothetical protein